MRKFKFVVPKSWQNDKTQISTMSRLVTAIELSDMIIDHHEICDILQKFNKQFKILVLNNVDIDAGILKRLIGTFKLYKLIINNVRVTEPQKPKHNQMLWDDDNFNSHMMDHRSDESTSENSTKTPEIAIELLAMARPSPKVLRILADMQLQCRKLKMNIEKRNRDFTMDEFQSSFARFLSHQQNMKEFEIKMIARHHILNFVIDTVITEDLKLEKLGVHLHTGWHEYIEPSVNDHNSECLTKLIKSQSSLKEIDITSRSINQDVVLALYQTENLEQLKLKVTYLPATIDLPVPCKPHTNVKSIMSLEIPSNASFDDFLRMFANIETLGVDFCSDNIVTCISNRLKSLKHLMAHYIYNVRAVSIPSLRTLQIDEVHTIEQLEPFLVSNPLLQELKIECIYKPSASFELLRVLVNLQKLEICDSDEEFEINLTFLRKLKEICPSLTSIGVGENTKLILANDVYDFKAIKVTKLSKRSATGVSRMFTRPSFDDRTDFDLRCVWNAYDSEEEWSGIIDESSEDDE